MEVAQHALVSTIETSPKAFQTQSGRFVRLERAQGDEHDLHFVTYFGDRSKGATPQEMSDLLQIAFEVAKLLAVDQHGDKECFSITLNGLRTGSWNEVSHVNIYVFESRDEKVHSYKRAVDRALDGV